MPLGHGTVDVRIVWLKIFFGIVHLFNLKSNLTNIIRKVNGTLINVLYTLNVFILHCGSHFRKGHKKPASFLSFFFTTEV